MAVGDSVFFFAMIFMGIGLMSISYAWKAFGFSFVAVAPWMLMALYAYTLSAMPWDVFYGLFWFGIGMTLVSVLEAMAFILKTKAEPEEEQPTRLEIYITKQEKQKQLQRRWRKAMSPDMYEEEPKKITEGSKGNKVDSRLR